MTTLYSHRDQLLDAAGESRLGARARRTIRRISAAFKFVHRAIVTARTRRMQRELMFHNGSRHDRSLEQDAHDAAEFPRRPLILGDKWDF